MERRQIVTQQSKTVALRIRQPFNIYCRRLIKTHWLCGSVDVIDLRYMYHCRWWGLKRSYMYIQLQEKLTFYIRSQLTICACVYNIYVMYLQPKKILRKNRRWRESLTKCKQIQSTALVNAARLRQHERLMLHLESTRMGPVAADIMYHQSCYN